MSDSTAQQKLQFLALEYTKLQAQYKSKEEECTKITEKNKRLENKLEEYIKNNASGNFSNITEIKLQYDKETLIMKELIKKYKTTLDENRDKITELTKEANDYKNSLNEERSKYLDYISQVNKLREQNNSSVSSIEMENLKLVMENSSLKSKLADREEECALANEQNDLLKQKMKELKEEVDEDSEILKKQVNHKNLAYKNLLKDYKETLQSLNHTQDQLEKAKFLLKKYEGDSFNYLKLSRNLEKENNELKLTTTNLTLKQKGLEHESASNRQKLQEYEAVIDQYKLSRQEFEVSYTYMKMEFNAKFTFVKEDDQNFVFIITDKINSRRFNFLDCEIVKQSFSGSLLVKFLKDKKEEEYMSDNVCKLVDAFNEFRRRAIEVHDFSSTGNQREKLEKVIAKKTNKAAQIGKLFDF